MLSAVQLPCTSSLDCSPIVLFDVALPVRHVEPGCASSNGFAGAEHGMVNAQVAQPRIIAVLLAATDSRLSWTECSKRSATTTSGQRMDRRSNEKQTVHRLRPGASWSPGLSTAQRHTVSPLARQIAPQSQQTLARPSTGIKNEEPTSAPAAPPIRSQK